MLIAISGGIGSGKSVVCQILRCLGYHVYDCDSRARNIMDHDDEIKRQIACQIHKSALLPCGSLDRQVIAEVVFNDPDKLQALNSIVHGALRKDLQVWYALIPDLAFVETAILYQSGLDRMVDAVWEVEAPVDIRISRVCRRNGLSPDQVRARIDAQSVTVDNPHPHVFTIINDDSHSLLLQIDALLHRQL